MVIWLTQNKMSLNESGPVRCFPPDKCSPPIRRVCAVGPPNRRIPHLPPDQTGYLKTTLRFYKVI